METIILGWYIVAETGSVLWLTIFAALYMTGTLIAPIFGVYGDRLGHRNLLAAMRAMYAALALIQMILALSGYASPLYVLMIAAIAGLVRPSDLSVRGSLTATIMPRNQLVGAMGIARTTGDTARIAGALTGAGLFAAVGMGPAYIAIVVIYIISAALTLCVTVPARASSVVEVPAGTSLYSLFHDLREGLVYVWTTPVLQAVMWVAFLANLVAYPMMNGLMPYIAKEIYGADQTVLGYLSASFASGAFVGSLTMSSLGNIRVARAMIVTMVIWFALLLGFAHIASAAVAIPMLLVIGFVQSFAMIAIFVIVLRTSNERLRGRVMGVRTLAIYGLPIGLLAAGGLIARIGYVATTTLYAAIGLVAMAVIVWRWHAQLWPRDAPANLR